MKRTLLFLTAVLLLAALLPLSSFAAGDAIYDIELDSRGVFFCHLETGTVLYDKNSSVPMAPAALTEIITCLCVLDACPDPKTETVKVENLSLFDRIVTEGAYHMQLRKNEVFTVYDLLAAMMLGGRSDAAELLAYRFGGGSVSAFLEKMNAKCASLLMKNTHFENAHGVYADARHVSTAADLARALEEAMKNPLFAELFSLTSYVIPREGHAMERKYETSLPFFDPAGTSFLAGMLGAKGGFTDEAGRCLASVARRGSDTYLLILLGSNLDPAAVYPHNMTVSETHTLLTYAFEHYEQRVLVAAGAEAAKIPVTDSDSLIPVVAQKEIAALVRKNAAPELVFDLPETISASSVQNGARVGTATLSFAGREISRTPLVLSWDGSEIHVQGALEKAWRSFAAFVSGLFGTDKVFVTLFVLLLVVIGVCIPAVKITQILHKRSAKPPKH